MIELDEWQKEIIAHDGNCLLNSGRQIGKTYVYAVKAALYMIAHPGCKIICVSLTEDQAQLIIIMILDYLERNHKSEVAKGKRKPAKNWIYLKNKSHVIARPVGNTGDAVRGFTGNVLIVDEASRMPEDMWIAAKPTLMTTGGQIWMSSTPHGKEGYYFQCYQNKENRYKVWQKNSEDVISERPLSISWTLNQREKALQFLADEKKSMTFAQYGQEYMGLFLDDIRQVFPDDLIRKCMVLKRPNTIDKTKKHYLGVDIARMGEDESTFEIMERKGDRLRHVESQITKKTLTTKTTERILELDRLWNFKQIFIDDGGMGVGVFDQLLAAPQTSRKTVAINNADRPLTRDEKKRKRVIKEEMINNMLMMMEKGNCLLLDDPEIFTSLKSMQYEIDVNTKKTKYFGNYTHIADGLWRACWAVKDKSLNIWVRFG